MAFVGVPNETRKTFEDGTNIFERVLPGRDRMYPDTDSEPIPLADEYINKLSQNVPVYISERYQQLKGWSVPEDTYKYLLSKNLVPLIERISANFGFGQKYIGTFLGHILRILRERKSIIRTFHMKRFTDYSDLSQRRNYFLQ